MLRLSLGVIAVFGSLMIGYCVYFDHKRRSAHDFRKRLREKRRRSKRSTGIGPIPVSALRSPEEMQSLFLRHAQLGDQYMSMGKVDEGAEHMCYAIVLCGQSHQLLDVLRQTTPPHLFAKIMSKLPEIQMKFAEARSSLTETRITEDDVE